MAKKIKNFFNFYTKNDKHFKCLVLQYIRIKKVEVIEVFENIKKENSQYSKDSVKQILTNLFSVQNIVIYIISFMISMVGFRNQSLVLSISPFAISFLAAMLSSRMPIGIGYILTLLGTFISFGTNSLLTYFLTTLVFFVFILIKRPKEQEEVNEQIKIGPHLFLAVLLVQIMPMFFNNFYVYDLLTSIMLAIASYIFYKIFTNAIPMLKEVGEQKAFSIEEVIGTSLLLAITFCAFKDLSVFGYNIRNILSVLLVLILGWKNGMLVGATSGVTIGAVIGIIAENDPVTVASYAISGLIAGIFYRLGKIGVIIGFIVGNILLTYVANGNTVPIILIQEILIASLGLLAVPKRFKINIQDLLGNDKLLPEATTRALTATQDTVTKLNSMSETIADLAKSYEEAASTVLEEKDIKEQELSNEQIFREELEVNIFDLENNLLYDDIAGNNCGIVDEIFKHLLKNEIITEKELASIFEKHNLYIIGFKQNGTTAENDVSKMIKAINSAYRVSKINFIWKMKLKENKKNVSSQLEGVSEVISQMAQEIEQKEDDPYLNQKQEILNLLKQKEIEVNDIKIKQSSSGRYFVEVFAPLCDDIEGKKCNIKKIAKIIEKILQTKFVIQSQNCGLREEKENCVFTYYSEDKYKLQVGVATSTKEGSKVSGDSNIEAKLDDGKYLIALSDGMGSGEEANQSSRIAINMLAKLLKAGFDKETSLKLINSSLIANTKEDMYTTLDIQILDLFAGNMEFIKSGACPTFVKRNKEVQLLKSITLPTGIVEKNELIVYDYDLEDGDILVMCSDGVIDSNTEYINKELWVKYLLEDISVDDAQQIANMVLNEAIDNEFGMKKDDMTVIVAKVNKKT